MRSGAGGWGLAPSGMRLPPRVPPLVVACRPASLPSQKGIRMGPFPISPTPPAEGILSQIYFTESTILLCLRHSLMPNHYLGDRWMDQKPYTIVSGVVMTLGCLRKVILNVKVVVLCSAPKWKRPTPGTNIPLPHFLDDGF